MRDACADNQLCPDFSGGRTCFILMTMSFWHPIDSGSIVQGIENVFVYGQTLQGFIQKCSVNRNQKITGAIGSQCPRENVRRRSVLSCP